MNNEQIQIINEITDLGYSALNWLEQAKLLSVQELQSYIQLLKSGLAGDWNQDENISLDSVHKIRDGVSHICTYLGPNPQYSKVYGALSKILTDINNDLAKLENVKSGTKLSRLVQKFAMKLGLQSAHGFSEEPIFELKDKFEPLESGEFETNQYDKEVEIEPFISDETLNVSKKENELYWLMKELQAHFHALKEKVDLQDFKGAWKEGAELNNALKSIKLELEKKIEENAA